ncbi:hypothetical protein [Halorussus halobius]|uniref:hypothetical protein n=1 Tax=Halorussus halobius TaxID=1710537 RepID=UPI001093222D|nr:hypothetical protein [Halorussus halobius]
MVLDSETSKNVLLVAALLGLAVAGAEPGAVNALPGFSDHTGPTEMAVASLERLDSGCADEVATYAGGSASGGNYSQVSFVETGDSEANLSAWVERTSPPGADLSTFRVHVESHPRTDPDADHVVDASANDSCDVGIQYRIEVTTGGGNPEGILPDDHGTRVLWLENGEYAGCSASHTGSLRAQCHRFDSAPDRTWANATAADE